MAEKQKELRKAPFLSLNNLFLITGVQLQESFFLEFRTV
jgi:hypothetical protein